MNVLIIKIFIEKFLKKIYISENYEFRRRKEDNVYTNFIPFFSFFSYYIEEAFHSF